jgi:hypothetical protein
MIQNFATPTKNMPAALQLMEAGLFRFDTLKFQHPVVEV